MFKRIVRNEVYSSQIAALQSHPTLFVVISSLQDLLLVYTKFRVDKIRI